MSKNFKADTHEEHQACALEVVQLRDRLLRAGLIETFQVMDAVVKKIGWEIAAKMEKARPEQEI